MHLIVIGHQQNVNLVSMFYTFSPVPRFLENLLYIYVSAAQKEALQNIRFAKKFQTWTHRFPDFLVFFIWQRDSSFLEVSRLRNPRKLICPITDVMNTMLYLRKKRKTGSLLRPKVIQGCHNQRPRAG